MPNLQTKVCNKIKEKGWSIVTTSERSGIPLATIKSIIYGHSTDPKITTVEKLANVFECKISDLLGEENVAENTKVDLDSFKECAQEVESYIHKNEVSLSKNQVMEVIDSLSSLIMKKKNKNLPYTIDDETIEWIIDNL